MTCQERRDLLLLYIAGGLEPAEMEATREHLLTGCPACAGALAEAEATFHQIPLSLPMRAAPEGAWEKLEMRMALKEQAEGPREEGARIAEMTMPARRGPSALAWTGWAAAAGVAIFMGVILRNANIRANDAVVAAENAKSDSRLLKQALLLADDNSGQLKTRLTSLEQKVKDLDTEHGKLLIALDESKQQFMADLDKLMHADQFALASKEMPGVTGTLFWNRAEGTWTVMGSNIKMPAVGKTLELWIITAKGEKIAAGTFMPDANGRAMHETKLPADMGPIAIAAVTDEPIGGDAVPTGSIQFMTDVSKKQ